MKQLSICAVCLLAILITGSSSIAQSVGIGTTTPASSAMLHINSTNKGLLIPRLTSAQRTAIASPAAGLQVYDTNTNSFWYYNGSGWIEMGTGGSGGSSNWSLNGTDIYNNNNGRVGIGTSTPLAPLCVVGTSTWGTASFTGDAFTSHFNYPGTGGTQNTYIRGGNAASHVILNDEAGLGNVGIGVSNPASKLEVNGNLSAIANAMDISGIIGFNGGVLSLTNKNGNGQTITIDGSNIQGHTYTFSGTSFRPVVLNPYGGNVGIGTNYSPTFAKLEIRVANESVGWAAGTSTYNLHTFFGGNGRSANSEGCYVGTGGIVSNGAGAPLHFFTASQWAQMTILPNGNVGIGTTDPTYRLSVNGNIRSKEVVVESNWADYVFAKDYKLSSLEEVEKFIQLHKHLPNIPAAEEIEKNGLHVGDVQKRMMEKIEELTLYVIGLKKELAEMKRNAYQYKN